MDLRKITLRKKDSTIFIFNAETAIVKVLSFGCFCFVLFFFSFSVTTIAGGGVIAYNLIMIYSV